MTNAPEPEPGLCLYAVGDVHGHAELLDALTEKIVADAARLPAPSSSGGVRRRIVMLGDYVDRGPDGAGVLDRLAGPPPEGFERVCLIGNHEEMMTEFLLRPAAMAEMWLANGGDATLESYGIAAGRERWRQPEQLALELDAALPQGHRRLLAGLAPSHRSGDYLFVHAGIDPGRPADDQDEETLRWIRQPFLSSRNDFGAVVVHGHTIVPTARACPDDIRPNRIAVDTGAYLHGKLSCARLHQRERRFLTVT